MATTERQVVLQRVEDYVPQQGRDFQVESARTMEDWIAVLVHQIGQVPTLQISRQKFEEIMERTSASAILAAEWARKEG